MKLSAPLYQLKRRARLLSRSEGIPLHQALDQIAAIEGAIQWSFLAAQHAAGTSAQTLYAQLQPGDLVLIGARPGHGKTLLSLVLAQEAVRAGNESVFFTLEYTERECLERFKAIGVDSSQHATLFRCDCSDEICAEYMVAKLEPCRPGTLVVVDYLQLLDQRRENPALMDQVRTIKSFAQERQITFVFICQIDRSYDLVMKRFPDLDDVRLPNPLDLKLFNKACFLNNGEVSFANVL